MKTILHLCMTTLAAYAFVPSATAQNSVPGSRPGESSPKPGVPAADTTPGDKKHADREGKPGHDAG